MQSDHDPKVVAEFENATWSRCAERYMDGFGLLAGEAVGPLLDGTKLAPGQRLLDAGTGTGLVASEAKRRGADPVGIDFSEPMVAEARRRHAGIEFRAASADALPFGDGEFDVVTGNFVLHHTGRPEKVLGEAHRVLRPGGRAGFTVWADLSKLEAFGLFFQAVEEHAGAAELPHGPLFGVSDFDVFHRMLADAGFEETHVTELPLVWRMPSVDTLLGAFRDWAALETFPADLREKIEAGVRERAKRYSLTNELQIPNPAILLTGVRKT